MLQVSLVTVKLALSVLAISSVFFPPIELDGQVLEEVTVIQPPAQQEEVTVQKEQERPINTNYGGGDCSKYETLIRSYDWPVETALQICRDESGGNASAANWNDKHKDKLGNVICVGSHGLMQIACIHPADYGYTVVDLDTPEINIAVAYKIWKKRGFTPWSTYKQ